MGSRQNHVGANIGIISGKRSLFASNYLKQKAPATMRGQFPFAVNLYLLEYGELADNTKGLLDAYHVAAREQNAPGLWTRGICEK